MSRESELDLARRMRAAEQRARERVRQIPALRRWLRVRGPQRTVAARVDALEGAVEELGRRAQSNPSLREVAAAASAEMSRARALRWELAWSGKRIAYGEARKIGGPIEPRELAQEGMIGLYKAAKRFDPDRGLRFSTYARWWARAQMTRAIDSTGYVVRMPAGAIELRRNLQKLMRNLEQRGEDWTFGSLAEHAGMDEERIRLVLQIEQPVSLDQPAREEGSRTLGDTLADEARPVVQTLIANLDERWASHALSLLPERERLVVRLLFGLDRDGSPRTLSEVGRLLGVSKERVRQIRVGAFAAMREVPRVNCPGAPPLLRRPTSEEVRLLDAVRLGLHRTREICTQLDRDMRCVRLCLQDLARRGYLERHGRRYYLPGQA